MISKTVEYVWIGSSKDNTWSIRSKTRVIKVNEGSSLSLNQVPSWNYDGSSTSQATGKKSEIILKPCSIFIHPFRLNGYIVICDTYITTYQGEIPHETNKRFYAKNIFDTKLEEEPWYGTGIFFNRSIY